MKTSLVALLLVLANLASGQAPAPPASQPQASPASAPAQKKEIKDPAEYNAYVGAVQLFRSSCENQRTGSVPLSVSQ